MHALRAAPLAAARHRVAAPRPPHAAASTGDGTAPRTPRKRATRKKKEPVDDGAAAPTEDAAAATAAAASTPTPTPAAASPATTTTSSDADLKPAPIWAGRRGGYTPFEFVSFADDDVLHDVSVTVAAPRPLVYSIWADRSNYGEWFSLITQSVHHVGDASLASYFVFYGHGTLPPLELYATMKRDLVANECILERAVDGWDIAAGVFFAEADNDPSSTVVTLRLGYALPAQLADAVGAVAVYGDVEEVLRSDMAAMAAFVEANAADGGVALAAKRAREAAAVAKTQEERYGLPEEEGIAAILAAPGDALYDAEMLGAARPGVGPEGVEQAVPVGVE